MTKNEKETPVPVVLRAIAGTFLLVASIGLMAITILFHEANASDILIGLWLAFLAKMCYDGFKVAE